MRVPGQDDRYPGAAVRPALVRGEGQLTLIVFNGRAMCWKAAAAWVERPEHPCSAAPAHRRQCHPCTHQTWALALNMLEDNRLLPGSQTAAFLTRNIAYDDGYTGLADSLSEGERLATVLGDKQILFMKNHGVPVVGDTQSGAGVPAPTKLERCLAAPRSRPCPLAGRRRCWTKRW